MSPQDHQQYWQWYEVIPDNIDNDYDGIHDNIDSDYDNDCDNDGIPDDIDNRVACIRHEIIDKK